MTLSTLANDWERNSLFIFSNLWSMIWQNHAKKLRTCSPNNSQVPLKWLWKYLEMCIRSKIVFSTHFGWKMCEKQQIKWHFSHSHVLKMYDLRCDYERYGLDLQTETQKNQHRGDLQEESKTGNDRWENSMLLRMLLSEKMSTNAVAEENSTRGTLRYATSE